MNEDNAKKKLFDYLDQRAFQPVLEADASRYSSHPS